MAVVTSLSKLHSPPLRPVDVIFAPVHEFLKHRLAGAILLTLATLAAIIVAISSWSIAYNDFLHTHLQIAVGTYALDYSIHHWINDGLMSIFFFLVELEIKRELIAGELSTLRKATLPAVAAIGGMVIPALFYMAFNWGKPTAGGWGIPMATDIAFALGVLALLGDRIPPGHQSLSYCARNC